MTGRPMRQRIATTAILFAIGFAALGARAVHLTLLQGEALKQRATQGGRCAGRNCIAYSSVLV